MQKQKAIFTLISLLSSLIAAYQLNFMLLDLSNAIYYRRKLKLSSILALSKQICRARLARPRAPAKRFWTRPGRTSAWWDNFSSQNVVPEEWKENFRMSRDTFLILCEELRPFIEKRATNMRLPVDVERRVASSLYYLSDVGRIPKTANGFGLSRQVISVIIRRVCIAVTVHVGPKYIKLPPTELKLKRQLPSFFIAIVFHSV